MSCDDDLVFKALADVNRRTLLDKLRKAGGLTLGALCLQQAVSRQAVSKHLTTLEAANRIVTRKQGREKLHYLNPIPINEIYIRWIGKFEKKRIDALQTLKQALEETDK